MPFSTGVGTARGPVPLRRPGKVEGKIFQSTVYHPAGLDHGQAAALPAPHDVFAVIRLGGKQYKVGVDDVVRCDKLKGHEVGEEMTIDDVLLLGSRERTVVGQPVVRNARVKGVIEEHTKDKKVIIFKKRRKKHSQRWRGFRRDVTFLRITAIEMDDDEEAATE